MKLLEVDHLKPLTGQKQKATLSFTISGNIKPTILFMKKVCPQSLQDDKVYYLHIYHEDNPITYPQIGVAINNDPTHGLKLRFDKGGEGRDKANVVISATAVINKMKKDFDWPLSAEKAKAIRYELTDESEAIGDTIVSILR